MKEKIRLVFSDNVIKSSFFFSLLLSSLDLFLVLFFFAKLPPYVPFFNSMPWGEKRLVESHVMLLLFFTFLFIICFNTFLCVLFYVKYPLISRIVSITSFLFVFLGFLASIHIMFLVF